MSNVHIVVTVNNRQTGEIGVCVVYLDTIHYITMGTLKYMQNHKIHNQSIQFNGIPMLVVCEMNGTIIFEKHVHAY